MCLFTSKSSVVPFNRCRDKNSVDPEWFEEGEGKCALKYVQVSCVLLKLSNQGRHTSPLRD